MNKLSNEPMSAHTTFRIGGPAKYYLIPESVSQVKEAIDFASDSNLPYTVIGKGSNLLVSDKGYDGVVIEVGKNLEKIDVNGCEVEAEAGISLSQMAQVLAANELTGFEFASGIPGTLGGAVTMNAGAYGGEIKDCIVSATVLTKDGEVVKLSKDELELGYRSSVIQKKDYIVLGAKFVFEKGNEQTIKATMKELNQRRRDKQPLEYPSAGSTFKRPEGYFAGKLIEDAGLKGYQVGGAQVSKKHSGFVVNLGNATAEDVKTLIQDVKKKVKEQFGVDLETEVKMIGE